MKYIHLFSAITVLVIISCTCCSRNQKFKETDALVTHNNETTYDNDPFSELRVTYSDGFTYEPISPAIEKRITGKSYPKDCPFSLANLRYLQVKYYDFDGNIQEGELIVNESIAEDTVAVFKELFDIKYRIEKIRLIDEYNADDDASMADNNTSAFNYRYIDGTTTISNHSYGLAIDINPLYNPYVRTGFGERDVIPVNGTKYADRTKNFKHKIVKGDKCYNIFISHGFLWGGDWDSPIDYQHFYKES